MRLPTATWSNFLSSARSGSGDLRPQRSAKHPASPTCVEVEEADWTLLSHRRPSLHSATTSPASSAPLPLSPALSPPLSLNSPGILALVDGSRSPSPHREPKSGLGIAMCDFPLSLQRALANLPEDRRKSVSPARPAVVPRRRPHRHLQRTAKSSPLVPRWRTDALERQILAGQRAGQLPMDREFGERLCRRLSAASTSEQAESTLGCVLDCLQIQSAWQAEAEQLAGLLLRLRDDDARAACVDFCQQVEEFGRHASILSELRHVLPWSGQADKLRHRAERAIRAWDEGKR